MKKHVLFILFFMVAFACFAQKDSISNVLEEVLVVGNKKKARKKISIKSIKIGIKQQVKNPINFTNLLRYNSPIAFRDYGNGGVSTARFRGTSASNTLVLWNGIPINSVGSGQTDFNALSANISDIVIVQSGGNSTDFGSGAIGGTVHLNDEINFKKHQKIHLFSSFGSFNTSSNFFKSAFADKKWSVKLASTFNYSDNNYTFIDKRYKDENGHLLKNKNGNYKNYGVNFNIAHQFNSKNKLAFYTTKYYGNRLFSDGLPNPSAGSERNEDFNQRNLLQWNYKYSSEFKQLLNIAYLTQEYRYYETKNATDFSVGKSQTTHINYNLTYRASNILSFNYKTVFENITGKNLANNSENNSKIIKKRNSIAFIGSVKYQPIKKVKTSLQLRKELNSDFNVPVSVFVAGEYKIASKVNFSANFSTNYRVPTYNEMYWPIVGNLHLVAENSVQGEAGVSFKNKNIELKSTAFYIHINDKILWLPAGNSNLWRPKNVNDVVHKGIESFISFQKKIAEHRFAISSNYTFTTAENIENNKILPYAPKHLWNFTADYSYKKISVFLQSLYQSKVYTNEINLDFYALKKVNVQNIGLNFNLSTTKINLPIIGVTVNNIFNKVYYFSNLRPMPGTNFNININYKF
ncbi:TonB-dependent receptor plug domain-containing protein [Tenacibaculum finnmarkense]|uniref:TonB-dependent receptor plug domain-containing protein n=1 Tax=Tenacibaculum finnmarkense TaxID=2781243 RepID=UPI00187B1C24|nr:TonB-dependent receptor [Tenacibaculum finnmarkense]MBE7692506.1 TonB-dependent receptor [Tenacibaculum finnmarkense genomovar finnmarkense]MCD8402668.1 TonB-dependent receptor [Tenacibaculum finnmarkense genomovar finnmarkense]